MTADPASPETDGNTETANDDSINESERVDPGARTHTQAPAVPCALPDGVLYLVRAWADFEAEGPVQLPLAAGDAVQVLHEANQDGWGYGYARSASARSACAWQRLGWAWGEVRRAGRGV